ncbi:MAG: nucleoside triphosphate pyrophosphohydrolase [Clostridia bacterium]|nr:nucleoside triphosphate pyrophosphohydrolase [Clostridia bacterium]
MKRVYNKLVRDKIPEIIEKNGEKAITKILDNNEYWNSLLEKVKEELYEIETAENLDETKKELADLIEVVRAMAENKGFSLSEIIDEADEKVVKRGGFSDRIFLIGVE